MKKQRFAFFLAVILFLNTFVLVQPQFTTVIAATTGGTLIENLDRGISAINTGSGMLVSWRFLANDADDAVFNLYRDGTLIYTSNSGESTCYLDASGKSSSSYRVDSLFNGNVKTSDTCSMISANDYFQINLNPPTSSSCTYSPNDCSVGDADGDGQYELFLKWDPSTSKDNSLSGKTDKVYIDCIKLDGTRLWRIDLGYNIRAGAHYTQMLVADYDSDGFAELICKTSDGTVDGKGVTIGDGSQVYRNSKGYILTGNEFLTLFDGKTGAALDTINYNPPRGTVSSWGDSYGNRCDRFLGAVAYLDGVHPSAVTVRGYYTRMTACAYNVVNKKLQQFWFFDSNNSACSAAKGNGNHNCMPADVDGDGKQELIMGATCINDDGTLLWCAKTGHGDALHVGDFLPERNGLEVWLCHEDSPYGVSLLDAATGKTIFHYNGSGDTGRCCADNVWSGNSGAEFWGLDYNVYNGAGNLLSCKRPAINFLSYWDGDLEREILDGYTDSPATISKMGQNGSLTKLKTTDGYYTCNTTKGTPCLSADILGDWREELVVRASDGKSIRIYNTTYDTDYRITTLMHDVQYRTQVAGQNIAYNQPPHASFYLGSDKSLPKRPEVTVLNDSNALKGATLVESGVYKIQNVNSSLYMEENDGNIEQSANTTLFRAVSAGGGYYYLYALIGTQANYCITVNKGNSANGANIEVALASQSDSQKFKFVLNDDSKYTIYTKSTADSGCIGVSSGSVQEGANIVQWESDNSNNQKWVLTQTAEPGCVMDTSKIYMFKNSNSLKFLEVASANQENGANVQQWGADTAGSWNSWTLKSAGNGYYYIISQMADGNTWYLDVTDGKSATGTNVQIYSSNQTSSQLFKFILNTDGTYTILTKASMDACAVEITDTSTASGANVQQGTAQYNLKQSWILSAVGEIKSLEGDINSDGKVDSIDIKLLKSYLLNISALTNEQLTIADINKDSKINSVDLVMLKGKLI